MFNFVHWLQHNRLLEILRSRAVIFIASNVTITVRILIRWWLIVGNTKNSTALWQQGSKNILQPNIVISRVASTMESKLITIVGSVNIQYLAYRKWKHTSIGIWTSKCKPTKICWWHNQKWKERFDMTFSCIINPYGQNVSYFERQNSSFELLWTIGLAKSIRLKYIRFMNN